MIKMVISSDYGSLGILSWSFQLPKSLIYLFLVTNSNFYSAHLFGRRLKSSQIGATFITIFLKCANIRRVLGKYYFINLCVSPIYEAGQKDSQVHSYNENLQSTFLKMLKCNFAMFSIWQASTWQTGVSSNLAI